jgi:plastocyanin
MKKIALTLVAALSLGVMAGCGSSNTGGGTPITVEAGVNNALSYSPSKITAKKGEKVTVHFVNKDASQAHTFVIKDFNAKSKTVAAGKSEDVTFTADKTGDIEFHCDVVGHETMKGTLTVN